MRTISERLDFLANRADLIFSGLRLHDYEHGVNTPNQQV
jgi:hypothetical protein